MTINKVGIILDMMPHFRYLLDNLFGGVTAVSCMGSTHIPERIDEKGEPYACTAEDAGYASLELDGGIMAQINFSWTPLSRGISGRVPKGCSWGNWQFSRGGSAGGSMCRLWGSESFDATISILP